MIGIFTLIDKSSIFFIIIIIIIIIIKTTKISKARQFYKTLIVAKHIIIIKNCPEKNKIYNKLYIWCDKIKKLFK